jgi:bifunctional enzyme CysN/CysC
MSTHDGKPTLRFITCGSVDDGKSTLIGRLLHEARGVFDDQLLALAADSQKYGTQGDRLDFALLVDGLQAEREQGITIDVAYRFFASAQRKFVVADTPGHAQYTRNMATGASTAQLAIVLVDARKGVLTQTRRHSRIVAMMGIQHVVLAINKMDLVAFDAAVFEQIDVEYRRFAAALGFASVQSIPLSALEGDNMTLPSANMPWYQGPVLMDYLNAVDAGPNTGSGINPPPGSVSVAPASGHGFSMPVQSVNRPDADFRGVCGRVAQGTVRPGDAVQVLPSGVHTHVKSIVVWQGEAAQAGQGDSITLTLTDAVDVGRGDVLVAAEMPAEVADQFEARLLWMADQPLMPGRSFLLKLHTREVAATITDIKYREDIDSGAHLASKALGMNDIAVVNLSLAQPVVFAPYAASRTLGGFILIDKLTFETVAAGMILFALRRAANVHWQALEINQAARAAALHQTPRCIWFTGLSGSGKSTIANLLEKRLHAQGLHTYLLDGDNVRHGLNRDLGFTEADRVENIRRVAEVARLMLDAGLVVLVSFISPYRADRDMARSLFAPGQFLEVFVDTALADCELRDPKGLYAKARRGELKNFTGIDSPYEPPHAPDVHLQTTAATPQALADQVATFLSASP